MCWNKGDILLLKIAYTIFHLALEALASGGLMMPASPGIIKNVSVSSVSLW
jgi:hypothetical protein